MKDKFKKEIESAVQELAKKQRKTLADLNSLKRKISKKTNIPLLPNSQLLKVYHNLVREKRLKTNRDLELLLRKKKIRSLSGIVNVSVLTKPYPCPGQCLYCPDQKGMPKSYLNNEPAAMRAAASNFNPYRQVQARIRALENIGHPADKIELRIIGGTWSFYPQKYQTWFVKECFRACNNYKSYKSSYYKSFRNNYTIVELLRTKAKGENAKNDNLERRLLKEQRKNEKAKYRIIGLSIETRPDFINKKEIQRLRKLGATMVELGVQSIYNNVLKTNKRGHKIEETIQATKLLKEAGFKVLYQMMLNLPGSDLKKDENMFRRLFLNPDFQPDMLKIYPGVLLKEAPLYKLWLKKEYKPYSLRQLTNLLKSIKKQIPYYLRIQRIIRDIPSQNIVVGPGKISNLRQLINKDIKKESWQCRCIRCREIRENYDLKDKLCLFRQDYEASRGKEIFLTFENRQRTKLYSLLRLRLPAYLLDPNQEKPVLALLKDSALIREVHTYGQLVPIREKRKAPQHKGFGKKLIKKAEKIAKKEFGINKIAVIAGIGSREYYRKLGYRLKGTYMIKSL
jgi:elongator complex protein 3